MARQREAMSMAKQCSAGSPAQSDGGLLLASKSRAGRGPSCQLEGEAEPEGDRDGDGASTRSGRNSILG